jgi:MocE subfamily Rieske [2Fe-2S] domain protein
MLLIAAGRLDREEATTIPDSEKPKVIRVARIWVAIYAAVIAFAVTMGSILPLMLVGLPRLCGAWHHVLTGLLQHGGLADNVTDHRLNSRTVLMNPISRFKDVIRWDHGGRTYALYHAPGGGFFATDGLCTHEQVHLADGLVMDFVIECPRHNGQFDYRTGEARRAPVCVNLATYPVRVEDGRVLV